MKKALSYFIVLAMLMITLVVPNESYQAYEANLSVSVSASTVKIGDTVTATVKVPGAVSGPVSLYFPTDIFEYSSTSTEASVVGGTIQFSIGKGGRAASDTVTVKLKAKTSGTANIKVEATGDIYDYDSLEEVTLKGTSTSVKVENQAVAPPVDSETPQKSDDNSLVSLKLSSGTLSPSFKGNVTKYTATVGYDVTKVVVSAKTSSSKATIESVTGNGTVNLNVGENTIQIVVKAENGVKATYTIVVTRKAQETTAPQPTESEQPSEPETTLPEENEILQWNGEQLQVVDKIPEESIPEGFESKLLVVNGQQMQGLSFSKGDLKALYLNNTNGAGSLYVYDEAKETIYPFIKLISEKSYVMILLPDEQNAPVPEGFESCTFSIEGKGIVSGYQCKEEAEESTTSWNLFGAEIFYAAPAKGNEFYLIYCMNGNGEKGWYMYDSVEGTYQRYFVVAPSVQVGGEPSEDTDLGDEYAELEKELNAAKKTQYIIIAVAAAIIVILIILLIVLYLKKRPDDDGYWDDVYEDDDVEEVEDDDEIEIEFCNMEEAIVEETKKVEKSENVVSNKDESDLEFIDFE